MKKIRCRRKKQYQNVFFIAISILVISLSTTFSFCFFMTPKLVVEKNHLVFDYDEAVTLPEYHAYSMNRDISSSVKVTNPVQEHKVGKYFVTYQVKQSFFQARKMILVQIVDRKKPVITLEGDQKLYLCPGTKYEEIGFRANDDYDGDITSKVLIKMDENKIYYKVGDSSHNVGLAERDIYYEDREKPVLTLKGKEKIYLPLNSTYQEEGYTVKDNCDKEVEVTVAGEVNTKKVGSYSLTYTATDSSHNQTTVVREVEVISASSSDKGTIYLTFDDGPSNSVTPKILDILKEKNVPATFFVIRHDDNLNYLIKREYQEGHTVALHSYTHTYSLVYQSTESYFNDLNQIREKVYQITGEYSNIIRFPGGSSNTISKRFNSGIMTRLVDEVRQRGFHYFDWNVDCEDGAGVRDTNKIYNNVVSGLSPNRENVVLMHDFENNYGTLNALAQIIDYGLSHGYRFQKITMDTKEVHHKPNN